VRYCSRTCSRSDWAWACCCAAAVAAVFSAALSPPSEDAAGSAGAEDDGVSSSDAMLCFYMVSFGQGGNLFPTLLLGVMGDR